VLKAIAPRVHESGGALDCHLMVDNPEHHFWQVAEAGGDSVTFHYEVAADPQQTLAAAREHGLAVGLAFNPQTEPEHVAAVASGFDLVLCMGINPGYSGQAFMPETLGRVERLRAALPAETYIQVDGGVGADNIRDLYERGASLLVCGTSIFGREDLPRAYRRLVQALA
jgi:ribulose-phosphate 3-epimerase